jgi:hypothetical protein
MTRALGFRVHGPIWSSRRIESTLERCAYCLEHFLIAWKSEQTFTRDDLIAHANRKLAFLSAGSFHFST